MLLPGGAAKLFNHRLAVLLRAAFVHLRGGAALVSSRVDTGQVLCTMSDIDRTCSRS